MTFSAAYAFEAPGGRHFEQARLRPQSALIDPLTERVLQAAGIGDGMHVLDLGSGAGDVTMLLARAVGPDGRVTGVERDADAIASARSRIRNVGMDNVTFVEGDIDRLTLDAQFDAVVGRLVLMFVSDPVATLRRAARFVRAGGIVCVHEIVPRTQLAAPEPPLFAELDRLVCAAFAATGAPVDLGERLPAIFRAAELPAPDLAYERVVGGPDRSLCWWYRDLLTGLLPVLERADITTAKDIELDTLVDRLETELRAVDGIAMLPPMIGAWCHVGAPD